MPFHNPLESSSQARARAKKLALEKEIRERERRSQVDSLVLSQAQKQAAQDVKNAKAKTEAKAEADAKALAEKQKEKAERDEYIYAIQSNQMWRERKSDFSRGEDLEEVDGDSDSPLTNPCQICFNRNVKYTLGGCNHSMCKDCIKRQFCFYPSGLTCPWCGCAATTLDEKHGAVIIKTQEVKKWMFRNSSKFRERVQGGREPYPFS